MLEDLSRAAAFLRGQEASHISRKMLPTIEVATQKEKEVSRLVNRANAGFWDR